MAALSRRATEAAASVAALANPFTRRVAEAIASAADKAKGKDGSGGSLGGGAGGGGGGGGGGPGGSSRGTPGRKGSSGGASGDGTGGGGGGSGGGNGGDSDNRCADPSAPFGFLDNMCGPMLRNFGDGAGGPRGGGGGGVGGGDDSGRVGRSGGRGGTGGAAPGDRGRPDSARSGGRRPTGSYDYDDETNVTDATGSYEDDDDTYDDDSRQRKGGGGRKRNERGRDRKPRSPTDSPSEMTGAYSEFDDDTTARDEGTEASGGGGYRDRQSGGRGGGTGKGDKSSSKSKGKDAASKGDSASASVDDAATKESEKLITQPLASGFAKRCYFTKAGIGRNTQHYEGLTLTGNTVLMLAAAMKLKGCPTICDEDLRRVEQTYPNQFSRLPDELLLSSGWRRISKYCHFSHRPLPDGVPFFHSRKRCHPNGGFYFLLCSAVGMTRLMDVEPLNRDALAVLQTDFPAPCERAPRSLVEDPGDWTLVNKFCFFSGGPINVEEDVYYRAELGGTEIYMLAFLSPSLSPEELYRLKPGGSKGNGQGGPQQDETGPLKSVAAVEEVESVYDLTERDFDDLKLYHLGPCRALPPYLLHPEAWTKILPPHFVGAREEALRIAREWEGRYPPPPGTTPAAASAMGGGAPPPPPPPPPDGGASAMMGDSPGNSSGYVELGGVGGRPPPSARSGMGSVMTGSVMGSSQGPLPPGAYPPQYPGQPMGQDPGFYPQGGGGMDGGYPPQHPSQYGGGGMDGDASSYYYGPPGGGAGTPIPQYPGGPHAPPPPPSAAHPYGAPSPTGAMSGGPSVAMGGGAPAPYDQHQPPPYGQMPPQHAMGDPQHWRDVHEEGAFHGMRGGDQPDDEAIATHGGMYGGMPDPNSMAMGGYPMGEPMGPGGMDPHAEHYAERPREDPPDAPDGNGPLSAKSGGNFSKFGGGGEDDAKSTGGGSSLMGGAQSRLKRNRMKKKIKERSQRPDLSTKLGANKASAGAAGDDSTWDDTRTDAESSYGTSGYGTSLVSGTSSYTDNTGPSERNSRRALILQMAKARMKNVKEHSTVEKGGGAAMTAKGRGGGDAGLDAPQDEMVDEVAGLELD
ncbi:hypothetical protein ACHAWF_017947 [Thalassiosira exigua]